MALIAVGAVFVASVVRVHVRNRVWPIESHEPLLVAVIGTGLLYVVLALVLCLVVGWLWGEAQ